MDNPKYRKKSGEAIRRHYVEHPEKRVIASKKAKERVKKFGHQGCFGLKGDENPAKRPDIRAKISKALKGTGKTAHYGNNNSSKRVEVKQKLREIALKRWHDPNDNRKFMENGHHKEETKQKIKKSVHEALKTEEYWNNWKRGREERPNKLEIEVINILKDLGFFSIKERDRDNWRYVGDGTIFIGGKCPDFIHLNDKKIIEAFGDYWHSKEDVNIRINHFAKYGYKTLIIWENELENSRVETTNKISNFIMR